MNEVHTRRTPRAGLAAAVVAAPLLWLVAELVSPALKAKSAAQLAVISAHPDRWYVYTLLLVIGTIVFVPAVLGVMRLVRDGSPRLAAIGGVLLGFGTIIAVGDAMTQLVTWQMVKGGADQAQMAALLDRFDNAGGAGVLFGPGGLAFAVGAIVLTIAMVRTHVVPLWAALAFGIGMVVQLVGFTGSNRGVIAASAVILLAAAVPVARELMSDGGAPTASVPSRAVPSTVVS